MDLITEMGVAYTFSVKDPTKENNLLERFHQKLMELILDNGLLTYYLSVIISKREKHKT